MPIQLCQNGLDAVVVTGAHCPVAPDERGANTGTLGTLVSTVGMLVFQQECEADCVCLVCRHLIPHAVVSEYGQHHIIVIVVQHHVAGQLNPVVGGCVL